jgi:hypothetical protein
MSLTLVMSSGDGIRSATRLFILYIGNCEEVYICAAFIYKLDLIFLTIYPVMLDKIKTDFV